MKIDFENIEKRCQEVLESASYDLMIQKFKKAKKVFLIGNGGLHYVASHMSTDLSRLVPDKAVYSFDSVGFITSNSNDHGFEKVFVRWLETMVTVENPEDILIVGMSCSGNSSNVIQALHWSDERGIPTFMISGRKSKILRDSVDELTFNYEYFHTVEVSCMIIFYDVIHSLGHHCPSITKEIERLSDSPLRN